MASLEVPQALSQGEGGWLAASQSLFYIGLLHKVLFQERILLVKQRTENPCATA